MPLPRFTLLLLLGGLASAQAGELLYNGIELPAAWPPKRTSDDLLAFEPMRVPYLDTPPAVIPIDRGRQLFVDDFLVERTTLTRRFHKAEPYSGNPILRPNRRWEMRETRSAMAYSDGCFYDPQDGLFKLWYRHAMRAGTCYAVSRDGLTWEKPELDVRPGTNIVNLAGMRNSSTVWLDHDAARPSERFKLFQYHFDIPVASVHTSPDGIHWSAPTWTGPTGDRLSMFYNPFRKVWVFSIRAAIGRVPLDYQVRPVRQMHRARKYWETPDFVGGARWAGTKNVNDDWPDGAPQFWYAADRLDSPNTPPGEVMSELFNLDAAPYESLMLGLFTILRSEPKGDDAGNELLLGFSRDGYHWDRPFREAVLTGTQVPKAWNHHNIQSVGGGCLVVGDRLYMYHSGRSETEHSTGLAFFRRDGFASMEAGAAGGTLTTRPVRFAGKHLFVNVDSPRGELRVEVLDREGRVLAPFTRENCVAVQGDATLRQIAWRGAPDLAQLAGQPVRFRFHLTNGALYAFWVSPDASGASHGFIGAGGPGFPGARDTVGRAAYEAAAKLPAAR